MSVLGVQLSDQLPAGLSIGRVEAVDVAGQRAGAVPAMDVVESGRRDALAPTSRQREVEAT